MRVYGLGFRVEHLVAIVVIIVVILLYLRFAEPRCVYLQRDIVVNMRETGTAKERDCF